MYIQYPDLTLLDDSHVLVLGVTGAVGDVGLTLQCEVVRQGRHCQGEEQASPQCGVHGGQGGLAGTPPGGTDLYQH